MSGIENPNLPQQYYNSAEVTSRSAETPNADWTGGGNRAASCAPGVGICTSVTNPDGQDWSRVQDFGGDAVPYFAKSQYIGIDPGGNSAVQVIDPDAPGDRNVGFFQAAGSVAPGAVVGQISSNDFLNRTDVTLQAGDYVWAVKDQA